MWRLHTLTTWLYDNKQNPWGRKTGSVVRSASAPKYFLFHGEHWPTRCESNKSSKNQKNTDCFQGVELLCFTVDLSECLNSFLPHASIPENVLFLKKQTFVRMNKCFFSVMYIQAGGLVHTGGWDKDCCTVHNHGVCVHKCSVSKSKTFCP